MQNMLIAFLKYREMIIIIIVVSICSDWGARGWLDELKISDLLTKITKYSEINKMSNFIVEYRDIIGQ